MGVQNVFTLMVAWGGGAQAMILCRAV